MKTSSDEGIENAMMKFCVVPEVAEEGVLVAHGVESFTADNLRNFKGWIEDNALEEHEVERVEVAVQDKQCETRSPGRLDSLTLSG